MAAVMVRQVQQSRLGRRVSSAARRRLAWALAVSAAGHLWIMERVPTHGYRAIAQVPALQLEARLERLKVPAEAAGTAEAVSTNAIADRAPLSYARPERSIRPESRVRAGREDQRANTARDEAPAHDASRTLPASSDLAYYSARELDVYPAPVATLRIGYPELATQARIKARVLLELRVDETGTVDQATVIAAEPAGPFEEHARTALAATRFNPGLRDGRAVRSRVTVRVTYDPDAGEATVW